jgi:hypothetical protein
MDIAAGCRDLATWYDMAQYYQISNVKLFAAIHLRKEDWRSGTKYSLRF